PALKDAIIEKFKRDNNLTYAKDQILVSSGGKQTCYQVCMAALNDGDECIIPAPYWVSYPDMALLAGGVPVPVFGGIDQGFKITPAQLEAAITDRSRLLFLNSPSNPTGAAYTKAELQGLGEVLESHPNIVIATDDMYEHIYWADEPFVSFAEACPKLYDQTLTMNGVSKAYAMTGWRIGYCGGPAELVKAMKKIQSQSTSNPVSVSQAAAVAALTAGDECIDEMLVHFRARHDYLVAALNEIPGFSCIEGAGTFYAFPDVSEAMQAKGCKTDTDFSALLLNEAEVALVPGSAFGADGYMRLSFATSMEILEEAIARIRKVLS
ncbi:MAG: pyridoxal phosphate-dependent aminotransferase, partial [Gammaproteobacteria bacterium]|nr:pyridoxal phosphate-dependent aminotransferase [Gammaproteobacteria bacterium]